MASREWQIASCAAGLAPDAARSHHLPFAICDLPRLGNSGTIPTRREMFMSLPSIEIETGPNPRHAVIWLHGLGADGHDFEPIVPELVDRAWPALRFVFPHAPVRPITINGGTPMRAWYDISGQEIAQRQDEGGIRASIRLLDELIERELRRGVAAENILLPGFS